MSIWAYRAEFVVEQKKVALQLQRNRCFVCRKSLDLEHARLVEFRTGDVLSGSEHVAHDSCVKQ